MISGKCYGVKSKNIYDYTFNLGLYRIFQNGVLVHTTGKESFDSRFIDVNEKRDESIDILLSE